MPKYSKKKHDLSVHFKPFDIRDKIAFVFVKMLRFFADIFFKKNYIKRALMLETVAGVPGMVAGTLQHLSILRKMDKSEKSEWIPKLLDEAENERMHLMVFLELGKPSKLDKIMVFFVQGIFFNLFFLLYIISPKTAHRIVGYFEEEAVISYTAFLDKIEKGEIANVSIPAWACDYWDIPNKDLRDLVIAIRNDEAEHRDVNHKLADQLTSEV
jgi:ubiquinol oxidase